MGHANIKVSFSGNFSKVNQKVKSNFDILMPYKII